MQRSESNTVELTKRLTQIADALGGRAPNAGAVAVWFDALEEASMADVLAVLTDWPKVHARPPVPAQVLVAVRERMATRIEEEAARNRQAPGFRLEAQTAIACDPEVAREHMAKIKAVLARPKPHPKAWAMHSVRRVIAGELDRSHPMAKAAIGICVEEGWLLAEISAARLDVVLDEEADREARLEREAIAAQ